MGLFVLITFLLTLISSSRSQIAPLSPTQPGIETGGHYIVGGTTVTPGEYPGFVEYRDNPLCGGILIYDDIVLTAATCPQADEVFVKGNTITEDSGTLVHVEESRDHPGFMRNAFTIDYDFRLLKIDRSFPQSYIAPLNTDDDEPGNNDVLTAIGLGRTCSFCPTSNTLLEVDLRSIDFDYCDNLYNDLLMETAHMCAWDDDRDTCTGDEGGPLFNSDGYVVGITSFGWQGCADGMFPSVYARVSTSAEWISATACSMSDECGTPAPTPSPTNPPTLPPTIPPTNPPTNPPTSRPTTRRPTRRPTRSPTRSPTRRPTRSPTRSPTRRPTRSPTRPPTRRPTRSPTRPPTGRPTRQPTSRQPSSFPTSPPPTPFSPTQRPTTSQPTTPSPTRPPTNTRAPTPVDDSPQSILQSIVNVLDTVLFYTNEVVEGVNQAAQLSGALVENVGEGVGRSIPRGINPFVDD